MLPTILTCTIPSRLLASSSCRDWNVPSITRTPKQGDCAVISDVLFTESVPFQSRPAQENFGNGPVRKTGDTKPNVLSIEKGPGATRPSLAFFSRTASGICLPLPTHRDLLKRGESTTSNVFFHAYDSSRPGFPLSPIRKVYVSQGRSLPSSTKTSCDRRHFLGISLPFRRLEASSSRTCKRWKRPWYCVAWTMDSKAWSFPGVGRGSGSRKGNPTTR